MWPKYPSCSPLAMLFSIHLAEGNYFPMKAQPSWVRSNYFVIYSITGFGTEVINFSHLNFMLIGPLQQGKYLCIYLFQCSVIILAPTQTPLHSWCKCSPNFLYCLCSSPTMWQLHDSNFVTFSVLPLPQNSYEDNSMKMRKSNTHLKFSSVFINASNSVGNVTVFWEGWKVD